MIYVFATFEKTGNLRYISHLDLQRAFTRLLLRSGLPVVFSEGFNPHPKLTFAQPLSIFQESVCEIAEFR
ncbi:MAG: TIGR03936 family radical SAM-associated protein, partial [Clostridiales bacterium]|nr:TIGR03936 family radical SAM-associated protein [Candidatus Coliplasma caballi]